MAHNQALLNLKSITFLNPKPTMHITYNRVKIDLTENGLKYSLMEGEINIPYLEVKEIVDNLNKETIAKSSCSFSIDYFNNVSLCKYIVGITDADPSIFYVKQVAGKYWAQIIQLIKKHQSLEWLERIKSDPSIASSPIDESIASLEVIFDKILIASGIPTHQDGVKLSNSMINLIIDIAVYKVHSANAKMLDKNYGS